VIAGAGYIAVEFAGVFAALGSDVTVVCRGDNVLSGFDEGLRQALAQSYTARDIKLMFGDLITRLDRTAESGTETKSAITVLTRKGVNLLADQVIMAIGRVPNSDHIGLATAGVSTDPAGAIIVDDNLRTSAPNTCAVGDVTNHVALTPVAIREGHSFADSQFGGRPWHVDYAHIPTAVFSTPEVGTVGLTQEQARAQFDLVHVHQTCFRSLTDRAAGRSQDTLMKIIVDGASGRILGVHLFAEAASEMIQFVAIALRAGATIEQFATTMAVHPTLGEEMVTMRTPIAQYHRETLTADGAG
jgi:glutathione reductase (NADPH)